jgi:hypothetical protein
MWGNDTKIRILVLLSNKSLDISNNEVIAVIVNVSIIIRIKIVTILDITALLMFT